MDVLVLTETKLDDSFPNSQFLVDGFSEPFRIDRNRFGDGLMIYVKQHPEAELLTNMTKKQLFCINEIIWLTVMKMIMAQ